MKTHSRRPVWGRDRPFLEWVTGPGLWEVAQRPPKPMVQRGTVLGRSI